MSDGVNMGSLTVNKAKGSIIVSSLPSNMDKDDIVMYFQSRKHGGGDIKEISVLGNGVALVTFEDPKNAKKVLEREHVVNGVSVVVKQYPYDDQDVNHVFSKVSAKIDPADIHLCAKDTRDLFKSLQKQMNVKCVEGSDATFVVSGSYQQIVKCHDILCHLLKRQRSNQESGTNVQNGSVKIHRHENFLTSLSTARKEDDTPIERDFQDCPTNEYSTTDQHKLQEVDCSGEIEISKTGWHIFSKIYKKQLAQLMNDYHVTLKAMDNVCKVLVKPTEHCSKDMLKTAIQRLSDMYNTEQQTMKCERFSLANSNNEQQMKLRNAVLEINKMGKAVLERAPDRQSWEIFGKTEYVEEILQNLGGIVEIKRLNLASEQANSNAEANDNDNMASGDEKVILENGNCDDNDDDDDDGEELSTRLVHDLGRVRVSVYRGDITNETSDAIVNAANQSLSHDAGVAKAIVSKGGQSIQDECRRIIATKGRKLETGEAAITPAGNLNCKMVIHAVGPIWNRSEKEKGKNLLKKAFLSSLQQAEKYRFNAIAFPAVSSGIYGMPKKLCATIMFDAVEEYNSRISPSNAFKVTDVRFVNNDLRTVKVFQKEFKVRYGHEEMQRRTEPNIPKAKHVTSQMLSVAKDQESSYNHHEKDRRRQVTGIPEIQHNENRLQERGSELPDEAIRDFLKRNYTSQGKITEQISGGFSWTKPQATGQSSEPSKAPHQLSSDNSNQKKRWRGEPTDAYNVSGGARPKHTFRDVPTYKCNGHQGHDLRKDISSKKQLLEEDQKDKCPVCLAGIHQPKTLTKCKHTFCKRCLHEALKKSPMCPLCRDPVQTNSVKRPRGTMMHRAQSLRLAGRYEDSGSMYNDPIPIATDEQPKGTMQHRVQPFSLPGYEDCGTILIHYSMSSGIQGPQHPNPGQRYDSTSRTAYLPDNHKGRDVMRLLKRAFDRGLVFTVGRSMTSGYDNQIVWGDIPHKTCINGGPSNYGYPDPTYLTEVQQTLKAMLNI